MFPFGVGVKIECVGWLCNLTVGCSLWRAVAARHLLFISISNKEAQFDQSRLDCHRWIKRES